jgi:hypothetical protein
MLDCYVQKFRPLERDGSGSEMVFSGEASTSTGTYDHWLGRLQLAVLFRHWEDILESERRAVKLQTASSPHIEGADLFLYCALARAESFTKEPGPRLRAFHLEVVRACCDDLRLCAEDCPECFAGHPALVRAELGLVEDRAFESQAVYEEAIGYGRKQGFFQIEAHGLEISSRLYRGINCLQSPKPFFAMPNSRIFASALTPKSKTSNFAYRTRRSLIW